MRRTQTEGQSPPPTPAPPTLSRLACSADGHTRTPRAMNPTGSTNGLGPGYTTRIARHFSLTTRPPNRSQPALFATPIALPNITVTPKLSRMELTFLHTRFSVTGSTWLARIPSPHQGESPHRYTRPQTGGVPSGTPPSPRTGGRGHTLPPRPPRRNVHSKGEGPGRGGLYPAAR